MICKLVHIANLFINRFLEENGAKHPSKHLLCAVYYYYVDYKESIFNTQKN